MTHPFWTAALLALALLAAPAQAAEPLRLTLLHVSDLDDMTPSHGQGGIAPLGTRLAEERAAHPLTLTTFGGDLLSPSVISSLDHGAHMVDLLGRLKVDAAVVGNHELDFGVPVMEQRLAASAVPWMAANMRRADGSAFPMLQPWMVVERGGLRIGLLGVITTDTATASRGGAGARFADPVTVARDGVAALKAQGAEVIIALTHLPFEEDRRLAASVPGIAVIAGGHDHAAFSLVEHDTLIIKTTADARHLAAVDLLIERGDKGVTARPTAWRFTEVAGVPPDPALLAEIKAIEARFAAQLQAPVVTVSTPMDSRRDIVRTQEAALGNLLADSLRRALGADVALINGGGLRGERIYPAGMALTRGDLQGEMPFGNVGVLLEVSGATLRAALEHGVGAVEAKAGRFPQVSGLAFTYSLAKPAGQRLGAVTVGGQPVEDTRLYKLATIDFLSTGGDGYAMLKAPRRLVDERAGELMTTLVAEDLARQGSVAPTVEGRSRTTP